VNEHSRRGRSGEEASGYSPVRTQADGSVTVELAESHPGFADPAYRARRDAIAALSVDHRVGDAIPVVEYTETEHEVWRVVCRELARKHRQYAARGFVEASERLGLPHDHIPQLVEVTARLAPLTAFRYEPVAGLAPLRTFYGSFRDGVFFSTQYVRHHSSPLYTPEPDIVHEVLGHANQLAEPRTAQMYRLVGDAVGRVETEDALRVLSRIFWFTFEFGVVEERGGIKAYGAGILSSFGELDAFRSATMRPFDFAEMVRIDYDITHYQPVLFAARSADEVYERLDSLLRSFDDDTPGRLGWGGARSPVSAA
jgi:phenylalanine-4-hydroxylase